MEKKLKIILIIAIAFIIIGTIFIITNPFTENTNTNSPNVPLKTQDFKLFEINIPKDSKFKIKNEAEGMKYYQNKGNNSNNLSGIIITKNPAKSLIGDNVESVLNTSTEQIYSFNMKNKTNYKLVSVQDKVNIILLGEDLNLLKEISSTIKIKNTNNL